MNKDQELELVKQIIWDGYSNLDVISFELDIPMDELIKLKKAVDFEKRVLYKYSSTEKQASARRKEISAKMRTITK